MKEELTTEKKMLHATQLLDESNAEQERVLHSTPQVLWIHTNEKIGLWPQETIDRQAKPR